MSHIASFNLVLTDADRIKRAVESIGGTITEGYFKIPTAYQSYNRKTSVFNKNGECIEFNGDKVAFGITVPSRYGNARLNHFAFTENKNGNGYQLIGDPYDTISKDVIQNRIENAYVNQHIDDIAITMMDMNYYEAIEDNTVELELFFG